MCTVDSSKICQCKTEILLKYANYVRSNDQFQVTKGKSVQKLRS